MSENLTNWGRIMAPPSLAVDIVNGLHYRVTVRRPRTSRHDVSMSDGAMKVEARNAAQNVIRRVKKRIHFILLSLQGTILIPPNYYKPLSR